MYQKLDMELSLHNHSFQIHLEAIDDDPEVLDWWLKIHRDGVLWLDAQFNHMWEEVLPNTGSYEELLQSVDGLAEALPELVPEIMTLIRRELL